MESKLKNKLVHDFNSGLSALDQSFAILNSMPQVGMNAELLPLCQQKVKELLNNWKELKSYLQEE